MAEAVAIAATLPAFYDPLQQLVVQGMTFSKEVRLDKRWTSIRQAAHVLSGEFSLPGWSVSSSITEGPYLCDIHDVDFESSESLCFLLSASKFNEIEAGAPAWYPLVSPTQHANTAPIVDMVEEMESRLDMLDWLRTTLQAPTAPTAYFWRRKREIATNSVIDNVNAHLRADLQSKKEQLIGTDAHVLSFPPIASIPTSSPWNDFLHLCIEAASSSDPDQLRHVLEHIPSKLTYCPKTDAISRPIDLCEDLSVLLLTLVVIHENIVTMADIKRYTGETLCFDSGPSEGYLHWWSDYSWRRFDTYHGRETDIGLPEPLLLQYMRDWKGSLQITLHVAKHRARLACTMVLHKYDLENCVKEMNVNVRDRVQIMRNTAEGRRKLAAFQKVTLFKWADALPLSDDASMSRAVPLRVERSVYDTKIMEIARRGLGNDFTTARSVRADIVPCILSNKPWVKDGVMSKIQGRYPVKLLCGGDVIKTEPISKTLFIYQVSSSWTEKEYPSSRQPLNMWVDGYRTRALALLVFEQAVCGRTTKEGYEELITEFERGVDLSGLYREGRLQRILNQVESERKWSQVMGMISSIGLSTAMEASVTRELIDLCMRSGLLHVFGVNEDTIGGGYLKLYGVQVGDGIIQFDSMVNLAGLLLNDQDPPFLFGRGGEWEVSFHDVAGEDQVHLVERIDWNRPYSVMVNLHKSLWMGTDASYQTGTSE